MGGGDVSVCKSVHLSADGQALVGPCGGPLEAKTLFAYQQEWAEIQSRFAPFTLKTATDRLVFAGAGEVADPVWERAILTWTHYIIWYAGDRAGERLGQNGDELWLGEVPEQAGLCRHLTVLVFGYAQADIVPCGGGDVAESTGG